MSLGNLNVIIFGLDFGGLDCISYFHTSCTLAHYTVLFTITLVCTDTHYITLTFHRTSLTNVTFINLHKSPSSSHTPVYFLRSHVRWLLTAVPAIYSILL